MILIFGGSGFIGTHFTNYLLKKKINFTVVINNKKKLTKNSYIINKFDYNNINNAIVKFKPKVIINLHGQTDIYQSFENPSYDLSHNVSISVNILQSIKNNNFKSAYIFVGTATQVGFTNINKPIDMNYHSNPLTIFDLNKQYIENFINLYKNEYNIKATTIRLANVIGDGKSRSDNRGIMNKIIIQAIKTNNVYVYGNGNFIRDFIHIEDVVKSFWLICKNIKKLNDPYYYVCSGVGISFINVIKMIKKVLSDEYNINVNIYKKKWPRSINLIEKRSFVGNNRSLFKVLNWKPEPININSISKLIKKII